MHLGAFTSWQSAVETRPVNASPASPLHVFLSTFRYTHGVRVHGGISNLGMNYHARLNNSSMLSSRKEECDRTLLKTLSVVETSTPVTRDTDIEESEM